MEKCFLFGGNGNFFCSGLTLFHILSLTKELQSSVTPSTSRLLAGVGRVALPTHGSPAAPLPRPAAAASCAPDRFPWDTSSVPGFPAAAPTAGTGSQGEDGDGYTCGGGTIVGCRCHRGDGRRWQSECFKLRYGDYFQRA